MATEMKNRQLGSLEVSEISLGCMNLSHAYGTPPDAQHADKLLNRALDLGYSMLDTAALYGYGENEKLLAKTVMHRRDEFVLASKCGIFKNDQGVREINGHPDVLRKTCEDSLQRLGTDVIDLYYLHRWDKKIAIEESVGALADLVSEGKIRSIGLSEVSSTTLRKAHAVHPIAALQTEYSLWTRNAEISVLKTCEELDVAFVAFSPVARGFLCGELRDVSGFEAKDIRRNMPRFNAENYPKNLALLDDLQSIAADLDCTLAQLSMAWLLQKSKIIIPIPGTTSLQHLEQNIGACNIQLDQHAVDKMDALINQNTVYGTRYNRATQTEIDTEEFESC